MKNVTFGHSCYNCKHPAKTVDGDSFNVYNANYRSIMILFSEEL